DREIAKGEMFKQEPGSYLYNKYNLLQLLHKIDANALYGSIGMNKCIYYNIYIANSITGQGRLAISISAMAFEAFLANNVKFRSLDEVIEFMYNVLTEDRKYSDYEVLDHDISIEDCFEKLVMSCGHGYMPTEEDLEIMWEILRSVSQQDLNRLFYKNYLFSFFNNSIIEKMVVDILTTLEEPYLDPNKPPKEILPLLEQLWDVVEEYVFYNYGYVDSQDRLKFLPRSVVLLVDTDSNVVHLDPWYKFILDKVYYIPMKIKYQEMEHFDAKLKELKFDKDKVLDYDFYRDEVVERERLINPVRILPQDNLRFSIINIMAYLLSKVMEGSMERFTKSANSWRDDKKCLMIMKNEYLFRRIMITPSKRNYATMTQLREGHIRDNDLDIKGLAINKTTLAESSKARFQKILEEDILKAESIDQMKVLKELAIMEKEILDALRNGSKEYFKPVTVKAIDAYDDPMSQQQVKAAIVWNALKDPDVEGIDLNSRNNILVVKIDINPSNDKFIKEYNEERYNKLLDLYEMKQFKNGVDVIGLPLDQDTPEWLLNYIDYHTIINDNLTNFETILECIGIEMFDRGNINYSNIIEI
ncbi:MAG: hypothetical protein GX277_09735, partial [Bacteroidales bacterium]|nr:hypothetical protein [Bacteroidales bacterium]